MNYSGILLYLYGPLVAVAYAFLNHFENSGVQVFLYVCIFCAIVHLPFLPGKKIYKLDALIRGLSFGASQVLLISAQKHGDISVSFIAAAIGAVLAIPLSYFFNGEKITLRTLFAMLLCVLALLTNDRFSGIRLLAVFGGFLQAVTATASRHYAREPVSVVVPLFWSYLSGAVVAGVFLLVRKSNLTPVFQFNALTVIALTAALSLLVQYLFMFLVRRFEVSKTSMAGLTKIPAAIVLDSIISKSTPALTMVLSAGCILIAFLVAAGGVKSSRVA